MTSLDEALAKATIITLIKWTQNFWLMSFFVHSPLIPWHHWKKKTQMLWLVHDIQILWHHCCEIHTLMQQSDWCKIHNLMRWSDWCEQHTTLQANITFSLIKKKIKNSKRLKLPRHQYIWTPSINDLCSKNIYSVWAVTNQ